ncbi:MAG: hypothetical protein JWM98_3140, partial [Thermoleophilia bacterium]|nr:hypothetical protein [Thermoleophilia bacterium]
MSGEQQPDEFARPAPFASWQALSGESTPAPPAWQPPPPPTLQAPAPPPLGATPQAPVHGGWQEAWQDEHGQWHAPWTAHQPPVAPPYQEAVAPQLQP